MSIYVLNFDWYFFRKLIISSCIYVPNGIFSKPSNHCWAFILFSLDPLISFNFSSAFPLTISFALINKIFDSYGISFIFVFSIFFLVFSKLVCDILKIFCIFQWRLLNKTSANLSFSNKNDWSTIKSYIIWAVNCDSSSDIKNNIFRIFNY